LRRARQAIKISDVAFQVRDYDPADEQSWLRCRVLSFMGTAYFDDVRTSKLACPAPGFELVAIQDAVVVGVLDVHLVSGLATIDTIAVHPDHQRQGIGTALLEHGRQRASALGAVAIDAWTRDDESTLRWYRSRGFAESDHYLHVYANYYTNADEPALAVDGRQPGLRPLMAFLHASLDLEEEVRRDFKRVHVCRRFAQPL
jgi:ribosomal protein S18 acetylase RimI-like enzyme